MFEWLKGLRKRLPWNLAKAGGSRIEPPEAWPRAPAKDIASIKGLDIIGRQRGQKRNRVHIYRQPYGYPIRYCDLVVVRPVDIEEVGRCQGFDGPAERRTLFAVLVWWENQGNRICRHCLATAQGKRLSRHGKEVA